MKLELSSRPRCMRQMHAGSHLPWPWGRLQVRLQHQDSPGPSRLSQPSLCATVRSSGWTALPWDLVHAWSMGALFGRIVREALALMIVSQLYDGQILDTELVFFEVIHMAASTHDRAVELFHTTALHFSLVQHHLICRLLVA